MKMTWHSVGLVATIIVQLGIVGCSNSDPTQISRAVAPNQEAESGHHHDGWWCNEHSVPEEVCALCNTKLVTDFKANGDWCKEHDRPDSQCFLCHPEKQAGFAALYEAKYGKAPPKPETDSPDGHDGA
jgi:cobalt-zinc-cadmium efflux system membrane fusion protein